MMMRVLILSITSKIIMMMIMIITTAISTTRASPSTLAMTSSWINAKPSELHKMYYPYELCVLKLAELGTYDTTKDIHHQEQCYHLLYPQFYSMDKRCWLGSRQQRIDIGICVTSLQYVQCTPLINRTSFWKRWSHLSLPSGYPGYAEHFIDRLHRRGYRGLIFAGDSMAVQYGQRLACSLLRNNASVTFYGNYFNMASGTGVSALVDMSSIRSSYATRSIDSLEQKRDNTMVLSLYRLPFLVGQYNIVHKGKSQMHGMDAACGTNLTDQDCRKKHAYNQIFTRITNDLKKYANKKWTSTLHIFALPIVVKDAWEMKPVASALLSAAAALKPYDSSILVLSPLSQHFAEHPQGHYVNISNRYTRAMALKQLDPTANLLDAIPCKAHTQLLEQHPDSAIFLKVINELDPNWKSILGWLDVTRWSLPWHDLHPESGSSGWAVDCTHYGYNPVMYDGIWSDLARYVDKM